ncbi:hypothetical protein PARPLA_00919 [Rhodobacteraceae bacterium THAF1]|uniref:GNAT family N-acetyltransferase n=1 Tax=Palleronia sp. THAF1 TaxID=2587842 RepID=UPI000F40DD15|nr:GNAT family N-acetyltransferase [Palleronia sp. THAF1]QFU09555.1 hypothetical protein FIU81_12820 [Palleronia sp. THAF1]VDC20080.1 hypothetical protein PARPLA_00919 [Rhodobacteraceae bacterium THAF1]
MTVRIASMRAADYPGVMAFLQRTLPDDWRSSAPMSETQFERVLADRSVIAVLAYDNDRVVGWAAGYVFPTLVGQGDTAMLDELLVDPAHRGKGIGTSLVSAFLNIAEAKAAPPVAFSATTDFPKEPAATPFQKTGGRRGGLLRQFDWSTEIRA